MTRAQKHLIRLATATAAFLPVLSPAHPGHDETSTLAAGFLHPLGGIDHVGAFILVGLLAARLGGRCQAAMAAAFAGLLVAAWTSNSDGWQFAAGFLLSGAGLIAASMAAIRLLASLITANAPRSPT